MGSLASALSGCEKTSRNVRLLMYDVEAPRQGSPFHLNRAVSSYLWRRYRGFTNGDILRHFIIPTLRTAVDENRAIGLSG